MGDLGVSTPPLPYKIAVGFFSGGEQEEVVVSITHLLDFFGRIPNTHRGKRQSADVGGRD